MKSYLIRTAAISFTRRELERLPENELAIFLTLCHAANELGVFHKLVLQIGSVEGENDIVVSAHNVQSAVLIRTLSAKTYEAVLKPLDYLKKRKKRDGGKFSIKLEELLLELQSFGDANAMNVAGKIRNEVSNHYLPSEYLKRFREVSISGDNRIIASDLVGNMYYPIGETYAFAATLQNTLATEGTPIQRSQVDEWIDWIIDTSFRILGILNELIVNLVKEHLPDKPLCMKKTWVPSSRANYIPNVTLPLFHIDQP